MKFIDDGTLWKKFLASNTDPYGSSVMAYAEEWANRMEMLLNVGKPLEEIAAASEPKGHGISGFQYGAAVATLFKTWAHGPALADWHEKKK